MTDLDQLRAFFVLGCCVVTMAFCWRLGWEAGSKRGYLRGYKTASDLRYDDFRRDILRVLDEEKIHDVQS